MTHSSPRQLPTVSPEHLPTLQRSDTTPPFHLALGLGLISFMAFHARVTGVRVRDLSSRSETVFLGTGRPPLASCSWSYGREFCAFPTMVFETVFPALENSGWDFSRVLESWLVRRQRGCVPGRTGRLFLHRAGCRHTLPAWMSWSLRWRGALFA